MKIFIFKAFLTVFLLAVATLGGIGTYGYTQFNTPSPNSTAKIITVPKGWGSVMIAEQLKANGIVTDSYVFLAATRFILPQDTLKAGEYEFPAGVSMRAVIEKLKKGEIYKRQFTIPEGLTVFEIIERLRSVPDIRMTEVPPPAEGSLLPDTYQYQKDESSTSLLYRMQEELRTLIDKEWATRDANLPFTTPQDALTLASIVEKETGVASERAHIAGVFINRLRQAIPLQSDPTVIYALTNGRPQTGGLGPLGRRLLSKDLEIDSPFNTYKNAGLPPAPIANAGRDAILAVLHPLATEDLFFVADGTGGHLFAKTLDEHNRNVANWRKIRAEQGK